jgi:hypothetical protein
MKLSMAMTTPMLNDFVKKTHVNNVYWSLDLLKIGYIALSM